MDVTEETTLTNLMAEYAGKASAEDWCCLIDLLAGSCLSLLASSSVRAPGRRLLVTTLPSLTSVTSCTRGWVSWSA